MSKEWALVERSSWDHPNAVVAVSGPVVRPTDETHARCFMNGYLRIQNDRGLCNGIGMISSRSLNKSSLFRYFTLMHSLIRLVFVASHLVCYSTMTSLDLWSDRLWAQVRCWHSRWSLLVITWVTPNGNNAISTADAHWQWHRNIAINGELFRTRRRECDIGELR